jgi:hypothetical protein
MATYYEKHKEERLEYQKAYYQRNKDKLKEYANNYNKENKEKQKQNHKKHIEKWSDEKKQEVLNRQREYREKNDIYVKCETCNCLIKKLSIYRHNKTSKHLKNVEKNK